MASEATKAQTFSPGPPCNPSGAVGFQIPNIGNTTNWGQCINYDLNVLDQLLGGNGILTLGSTTPSVVGRGSWVSQNTSSVSIVNFTGGYPGQTIRIFCGTGDTFTQVVASSTITISSSFSCASSSAISFTFISGHWIENSRYGGSGGGGGGGSVVNVAVGSLTPLFSATVSSPSFSPVISFTQLSATQGTVFGNCTGAPAFPTFCNLTTAMLPSIPFSSLTGSLAGSQFGPLTGDVTTSLYVATLAASGVHSGDLRRFDSQLHYHGRCERPHNATFKTMGSPAAAREQLPMSRSPFLLGLQLVVLQSPPAERWQ